MTSFQQGVGSADKGYNPVQKAISSRDATQCGYCTPGLLVTARALLDESPGPDRATILEAIAGQLCRCTGYIQIAESIEAALPGCGEVCSAGRRLGEEAGDDE